MADHTHGTDPIHRKIELSDNTTSDKRENAYNLVKKKIEKLEQLLASEEQLGTLDESDKRKKAKLIEIITSQLNIYFDKGGTKNDNIIEQAQKLLTKIK